MSKLNLQCIVSSPNKYSRDYYKHPNLNGVSIFGNVVSASQNNQLQHEQVVEELSTTGEFIAAQGFALLLDLFHIRASEAREQRRIRDSTDFSSPSLQNTAAESIAIFIGTPCKMENRSLLDGSEI